MSRKSETEGSKARTYKNKEEQARFENFDRQKARLIAEGYKENIGVISIVKANIMAFVTAGPFAVLSLVIYMLVWREATLNMTLKNGIIFIVAMFASIVVHEMIHGITWSLFCKGKWKSIHFGIMMDSLTPYCHCKEPLKFGGYILGGLMPFLVLGVGVCTVGILMENFLVTFIGAFNILSAGGDTTIALMLLKYRNAVIIDHPNECGFIAFTKA